MNKKNKFATCTLFALTCLFSSNASVNQRVDENQENISFYDNTPNSIRNNAINEQNMVSDEDKEMFLRNIVLDEKGKADLDTSSLFYECDCEESERIATELSFVNENIKVSNKFVDMGYGFLDNKGDFHLTIQEEAFVQQENYLTSCFFNIFKGWSFDMNPIASFVVTGIGICANVLSISTGMQSIIDFSSTMKTSTYALTKGLKYTDTSGIVRVLQPFLGFRMAESLAGSISSFGSNLNIDELLPAILNSIALISVLLTKTSGIGWIVAFISTVISCYTPNIITAFQMCSASRNGYGSHGNIGLFWSSYLAY